MSRPSQRVSGIIMLAKKYANAFRIRENIDHYSKKDFDAAEKRFVKYCLKNGGASFLEESA